MCSRFELNSSPRDIADRFALGLPPPLVNAPDVRPTDMALVIRTSGEAAIMAWGFEVDWDNKPLINARSETLAEKITFQSHLNNRCIIPASAYFEWRSANGQKLKNRILPSDQNLFAMAGLTDGKRFSIITCAPAPSVADIHNRMPVVLNPASEAAWINPGIPFDDVKGFLIPYNAAPMTFTEDVPPEPRQKDLFS